MNEKKALSKAETVISDLEDKNQFESPASQYSFNPGDIIGILQISKLNKELPIIEGTDESELERGVGHYSSTKLPNQQDRIFLAGHRDTVFKKMGELQKGDKLTLQMKAGTHTYEIFETLIVKETDLSVLKSTAPQEVLTLSTCYPFEYLSSTTERYIINARRIE
ncbi:class D sortase [Rossellomorea sp. SC111]|uniref:class D sortase n=1 Tax=Rossellomorea sp. SC111 TaxID=2968985 RepID=UPI00215A11B7|nr:class D sortase [Rossellomorea sp. SC111]